MLTDDASFDDQDIYVYRYPSLPFGPNFSIDEIAGSMRDTFRAEKIFDYKHITFVSHSMGGIVTREFILQNAEIIPKIRFLYFFATPTDGNSLAGTARLLSVQLSQLNRMEPGRFLESQIANWQSADLERKLKSYCAYEVKPTRSVGVLVDMPSATHLCNKPPVAIYTSHVDIVKPTSIESMSYRALKAAFEETVPVDNLVYVRADENDMLSHRFNLGKRPLFRAAFLLFPATELPLDDVTVAVRLVTEFHPTDQQKKLHASVGNWFPPFPAAEEWPFPREWDLPKQGDMHFRLGTVSIRIGDFNYMFVPTGNFTEYRILIMTRNFQLAERLFFSKTGDGWEQKSFLYEYGQGMTTPVRLLDTY